MGTVVMITGSYPPEVCGVGTYTSCVMTTATGSRWKLYRRTDWRLSQIRRIIAEVDSLGGDRLFLLYPTQGYGWSLTPHLLCAYYSILRKARFTVVLHEFSGLSKKARFAATLMIRTAYEVIFTNSFEQKQAARIDKSIIQRSRVVKIASNIPVAAMVPPLSERKYDLGYFGHIRPRKGLEAFLSAITQIRKQTSGVACVLIGQVPAGFKSFAESIVAQCEALGVEVKLGLSDSDAAETLANVKAVYLPFPDGVSERRGTAMAALANGAMVLTTTGEFTTPALRAAVVDIPSLDAATRILEALQTPHEELALKQAAAQHFLHVEIPSNWETVASAYLE